MEESKVKGDKLKDKLKELIREGNVRRIVLKNPKGRVLLDMPLNAGVVGFALAPFWAAVAAVAVLATDYTVAVERDKTTAVTKPPETKTCRKSRSGILEAKILDFCYRVACSSASRSCRGGRHRPLHSTARSSRHPQRPHLHPGAPPRFPGCSEALRARFRIRDHWSGKTSRRPACEARSSDHHVMRWRP